MQGYNVILIYSPDKSKILMCERTKQPYLGLKNLVGGRIEFGEKSEAAAYREMEEETSITRDDIKLSHLMTTNYFFDNCWLDVFVGKLKYHVEVYGDENPLCWVDIDENFFDITRFAGDGNIGHIMIRINQKRYVLFGE